MKISIITVCKNSAQTITTTIKSVINQTYKHIEYIIIDGASADHTYAVVKQYQNHINFLVSEPDQGLYEAMNKGIKYATGDFLYFLNSDDYIYHQDVISNVVDFIKLNPHLDFIYGDCETRSPLGIRSIHKPVEPAKILDEMLILRDFPIQAAAFFKADLFTRIGNFSQKYKIAGDYEWYTRMMYTKDIKLAYLPHLISSFYQGGLSSNFRQVFTEVWEIQDQALIFQTADWQRKRVFQLQNLILETENLTNSAKALARRRQYIIELLRIFGVQKR